VLSKSVTSSLKVIFTKIGSEFVGLVSVEVIVTVGATVSFVTVSVASAPSLPAGSVKLTVKVNVPSAKELTSIPEIVSVAVAIVPELVTEPEPVSFIS
jgi:hypothetical protein